jgi:hypothetical protein
MHIREESLEGYHSGDWTPHDRIIFEIYPGNKIANYEKLKDLQTNSLANVKCKMRSNAFLHRISGCSPFN